MFPPESIDFLETLERSGGGRLCVKSGQQLLLPYFAGSSSNSISVSPPDGTYVALVYRITFGQTPPNVFNAEFTHYGERPLGGVITAEVAREGLYVFMPLTGGEQLNIRLTNRDTIAHYYEQNLSYLGFTSAEDWDTARLAMEIRYNLRLPKAEKPSEPMPPIPLPVTIPSESRRSSSVAPLYNVVERPR